MGSDGVARGTPPRGGHVAEAAAAAPRPARQRRGAHARPSAGNKVRKNMCPLNVRLITLLNIVEMKIWENMVNTNYQT